MTETAALPRSIWLLSESRRSVIAMVITVALSTLAMVLMLQRSDDVRTALEKDPAGQSLLSAVLAWTIFATLHTALTWYTYRGLKGDELWRAVAADPTWRNRNKQGRSRWARRLLGFGPRSWASSVSVLALAAVITMVLRPGLRAVPIALLVAVAMVVVSWLNVALIYTLHYVRVDQGGTEPGTALAFPGEAPNRLHDYLYLAAGVQATFGTTDVEVRTTEMRTLVLGQSVLAFAYNTAIVGMVISLLLGLR